MGRALAHTVRWLGNRPSCIEHALQCAQVFYRNKMEKQKKKKAEAAKAKEKEDADAEAAEKKIPPS